MHQRSLFLLVMALATVVHAEPKVLAKDVIMDPASLPEPVKAEGRRRFDAGMQAMQNREFERAYNEFRAAFAAVPSLATLGNLGLAELETQRYVDAATHLRDVIRIERGRAREAPQFVLDGYQRALQKVGRLKLVLDPVDATASVDGTPVDAKDTKEEWFGAAGEHRVRVEKPGYRPFERAALLEAGALTTLDAKLEPLDPATAGATSGSASAAPSGTSPLPTHTPPSAAEPRPGLSTKTIVVGAGATLTVVAGVLAAVYAVKAGQADDKVQTETRRIEALDSPQACETMRCAALERALDDRYSAGKVASAALNVTLALGVATAATFVLWPGPKRAESAFERGARLHVKPTGVAIEVSLP